MHDKKGHILSTFKNTVSAWEYSISGNEASTVVTSVSLAMHIPCVDLFNYYSFLFQRLAGSHKHAESVVQVYLLPYNIVLLLEHSWM